MLRIGEAAKMYGVSNRTLRHWEEVGVLKSTRQENGYRYYDDANIVRINQISLLRKLKMPIADIEQIFVSDDPIVAVGVLSNYLTNLKQNAAIYASLAVVVERLTELVKSSCSLEQIFLNIEAQSESIEYKCEQALKIQLSERIVNMEHLNKIQQLDNVRIVRLPPMIVASNRAVSATPEADCTIEFDKFVLENNLHKQSGFRSFGFNNPEPSEGSPIYGYEMWVAIPENFDIPSPLEKKQFDGGLYASISANMNEIGERWQLLGEWCEKSDKYDFDLSTQWLEELVMDYETFISEQTSASDKQLDLLLPIKLK